MSGLSYRNERVYFQNSEGNFVELQGSHVVITREEAEECARRLAERYRYIAQCISPTLDHFVFDYSNLLSTEYPPDTLAYDARPEYCWRCNEVPAFSDLGLCRHCHTVLTDDKGTHG